MMNVNKANSVVYIKKKSLITIRLNKKEADEIFDRAYNKKMPVGKYVKWFIKQSLREKEVK